MGKYCSKIDPIAFDKKVVIVGCSFAGFALAEKLWSTHEVIMIDKNEYFEYICTASRSLIDDSHFDQTALNYIQILRTHAKKVEFIHATLEEVFPEQN